MVQEEYPWNIDDYNDNNYNTDNDNNDDVLVPVLDIETGMKPSKPKREKSQSQKSSPSKNSNDSPNSSSNSKGVTFQLTELGDKDKDKDKQQGGKQQTQTKGVGTSGLGLGLGVEHAKSVSVALSPHPPTNGKKSTSRPGSGTVSGPAPGVQAVSGVGAIPRVKSGLKGQKGRNLESHTSASSTSIAAANVVLPSHVIDPSLGDVHHIHPSQRCGERHTDPSIGVPVFLSDAKLQVLQKRGREKTKHEGVANATFFVVILKKVIDFILAREALVREHVGVMLYV